MPVPMPLVTLNTPEAIRGSFIFGQKIDILDDFHLVWRPRCLTPALSMTRSAEMLSIYMGSPRVDNFDLSGPPVVHES